MSATRAALDPSLGAPGQPAAGLMIVNASSVGDFEACPRRYWLRWCIGAAATSDEIDDANAIGTTGESVSGVGAAARGLATHRELFARHADGLAHHDDADFVDVTSNLGDARVLDDVLAHGRICPSQTGAEYLGGEVDLRWFLPGKALLLTGRADALWKLPNGTIELRDYKTGACADNLRADLPAGIYGVLAAANYPGHPARVVYEVLSGEAPVEKVLEVDQNLIDDVVGQLRTFADTVRREGRFAPTPAARICRHCDYRATCPSAVEWQP